MPCPVRHERRFPHLRPHCPGLGRAAAPDRRCRRGAAALRRGAGPLSARPRPLSRSHQLPVARQCEAAGRRHRPDRYRGHGPARGVPGRSRFTGGRGRRGRDPARAPDACAGGGAIQRHGGTGAGAPSELRTAGLRFPASGQFRAQGAGRAGAGETQRAAGVLHRRHSPSSRLGGRARSGCSAHSPDRR